MKENILESSKGKRMSIQSCLERREKKNDYGKADGDEKWGQIDTLPEKIRNMFLIKLEIMKEIMTRHKLSSDYYKLNAEGQSLVIDILQDFFDNFVNFERNIRSAANDFNVNKNEYIRETCEYICKGLRLKEHLTKNEFSDGTVDKRGDMVYKVDNAESKAKELITNLPSFKLRCEHMSLNEILTADDLFNFLDEGQFEDLKKVFDANVNPSELKDKDQGYQGYQGYQGFTKAKMLEFGSVLLNRVDVQENFESAQKAIKFYYQKLPELIKSQLINNETSKDEKYIIEENSTPKLSFAWSLLKKYDENIKSGKIKDKNGDDFKKLQECVADCTKDIFSKSKYGDMSKHMSNISKFINMYETKDTTDFNSLNNNGLKNSIDQMMKFFNSEKIIDDSIVGLGLPDLSDADIGFAKKFWEAFLFFCCHPIAFWYKENKAEYRIKFERVERFADQIKDPSRSVNVMVNGTNKQTSVFDLLNDAGKILPQSDGNIKQNTLE